MLQPVVRHTPVVNARAEIRAGGESHRGIGVAGTVSAPDKAFGVAPHPHGIESLRPKPGAVRAGRL
jgi:hypothetical protein